MCRLYERNVWVFRWCSFNRSACRVCDSCSSTSTERWDLAAISGWVLGTSAAETGPSRLDACVSRGCKLGPDTPDGKKERCGWVGIAMGGRRPGPGWTWRRRRQERSRIVDYRWLIVWSAVVDESSPREGCGECWGSIPRCERLYSSGYFDGRARAAFFRDRRRRHVVGCNVDGEGMF